MDMNWSDDIEDDTGSDPWGLFEWSLLSSMVVISGLWLSLLFVLGHWLWEQIAPSLGF